MEKEIIKNVAGQMEKAVENLKKEFSSMRTGRAQTSILDNIMVEYYGAQVPIKQLATIMAPEPRLIEIKPWDKTTVPLIEKAILKSDIGINPLNDGKIIRLNIPLLTEERRLELMKIVRKISEDYRIEIRNIRRTATGELKGLEENKQISEDEKYKSVDEIQKITDGYVRKIDEQISKKEKEIMEV